MSKIIYANKVMLSENSNVADVNKVKADDLNEIKNVVNANDDNVGNLADLKTTDVSSIVNAVNELVDKVNYEISTSGNWTIKKYDNGYVEMWLNEVANRTTSIFGNTPIYFGTYNFTFPITLVGVPLSINAISQRESVLLGMSINSVTTSSLSMFLLSFGAAISNEPVRTYLYVLGKWK